ncbi:MAG: hypothetical protein WC966_11890 [Bradymonadales bacterium]
MSKISAMQCSALAAQSKEEAFMDAMLQKLTPIIRLAPKESERLSVRAWGDISDDVCHVYLYSDVLEELVFAAQRGIAQSCLLTGLWYIDEAQRHEFVEIDGFRELIPVEDSVEFSHYLRKNRALLRSDDQERVTGACHIRPHSKGLLSAADALCHRSFFNYSYQISFILDAQNDRCCTYLIDSQERLRDCALFVLSPKKQKRFESDLQEAENSTETQATQSIPTQTQE